MKTVTLLTLYAIGLCGFLTIICITSTMKHTIHTLYGNVVHMPHNKKIVLVGGCFDILHFGHMQFLQKAKEAGDYLIVALEPDERILQKNRHPVHTQQERAQNLLSLKYVDDVIMLPLLHGFHDYNHLVETINPDVIAITAGDPQLLNKQKQAENVNAQCIIVTESIGYFSSSAIYKALL